MEILNNNNNRSFNDLTYSDRSVNGSANVDQQQILCILLKSREKVQYIQYLLAKHPSIFRNSRIIDLQEFTKLAQSTITNRRYQDASTMTHTDQVCRKITSCISLITQTENERRLKALEYIRMFIETNKEDFLKYLIDQEHLCQQKTQAIYQIIKQFLKVISQTECEQKQNYDKLHWISRKTSI